MRRAAVVLLWHRGVPPASPVPPSSRPPRPSVALGRKRSSRGTRWDPAPVAGGGGRGVVAGQSRLRGAIKVSANCQSL